MPLANRKKKRMAATLSTKRRISGIRAVRAIGQAKRPWRNLFRNWWGQKRYQRIATCSSFWIRGLLIGQLNQGNCFCEFPILPPYIRSFLYGRSAPNMLGRKSQNLLLFPHPFLANRKHNEKKIKIWGRKKNHSQKLDVGGVIPVRG